MAGKKPEYHFSPLISHGWPDYQLIDSGDGRKLERFGNYLLNRPEAEAVWSKCLSESEWQKADATYVSSSEEMGGHWVNNHNIPSRWDIKMQNLRCLVQLSSSRHIGIFPDQFPQWEIIKQACEKSSKPINMINLFGYTGLATLTGARAGAKVTHLDASPKAINWARENQSLSRMDDSPIRWIVDDALKYLQREAKRGVKYDVIILDPPKFGRGPKGEVWEFYRLLPDLLKLCQKVLAQDPKLVILTAYAVKASSFTLLNALRETIALHEGQYLSGELLLQEKTSSRCLSTAVFAQWVSSSLS